MEKTIFVADRKYIGCGDTVSESFYIKDNKIIRQTFVSGYWNSQKYQSEITKEELEEYLYSAEKDLIKEFNEKLEKITKALDEVDKI